MTEVTNKDEETKTRSFYIRDIGGRTNRLKTPSLNGTLRLETTQIILKD